MPTRSSSCDLIAEAGINNYYNNNSPALNNIPTETEISNTQSGRFKISVCHSNSPSDFVKLSQMCTKISKFSCDVEVAPPNLEEEFHRSNTVIPNSHNSCIQCDDLIRF
ncbi:hypothetical protein TVAG_460940 [Trichomonas vaginalis G3]|uniref:Uncharacterized protein n=1 Tax=Trichomonas vaginalis (strain ATCC PRA-98 / G3) TaxID=412133 RepID=A2DY68_TRIV3|nr:hypothetical protein TVAGG3_0644820 [Trichomonas vaginalis G3]EAY14677.1 hypothetical protein TVAG_460940 [Trichomonas vaginalis G3]KAI5505430.1 hypothetical protein TVAGG3_0644820 [Trichomonas vaginalis G3]|eukprot:XP_001326900.1 hypothetical protein [Trichomonas vaginalis G3]